jgi:YVTN family beta-propeller protein
VAIGEGAVWVANSDDGTVSRIDPGSNEVTATIAVGREPLRIITAYGAVWVTNRDDGTLVRIT